LLSHIAARQEVRDLLRTLKIPALDERIAKTRTDAEKEAEEEASADQKIASLPMAVPAVAVPEKPVVELAS
jgi:hypothetical protein